MSDNIKDKLRYYDERLPFRLVPALISVAVLITMLLMPVPEGLEPNAWAMLAIFVTTILAIILKVMPLGVLSMIGVMAVALTQVTNTSAGGAVNDALSAFSNPLIWLIVVAIMISRGLIKSGLGRRIGYMFIAALGKRTIGVAYGIAASELVLAPVTPSNTARAGGIIHPIMRSIATTFDSDPEKGTQSKIGTYLALVNMHGNPISSGMFITATAPNPLVVNFVAEITNQTFHLTWTAWALYMLVPGLVCMAIMPIAIYFLSPPEIKETPDAVSFARTQLADLGPLATGEKIMIGTFVLLILMWANVPAMIFGSAFTINPTTTALVGLTLLFVTGTLTWNDALAEKASWDTLVWFGALVMMANMLNKVGVISWISDALASGLVASGLSWPFAAAALVLIFTYSHYMFASTTAHISAMMLAFFTVGAMIVPPDFFIPFLLMMVAGSTIMMGLTHYATGTSPVIFGSGYVTMGKWWSVGFVMSVIELAIYATIGMLWWKVLGLW